MKTQELYAITYNADGTEGRGATMTLGYTTTLDLANQIVSDPRFSRWCVMGYHDAKQCREFNVRQQPVIIFENVDEPFNQEKERTRLRALNKLSKEEREALGLE